MFVRGFFKVVGCAVAREFLVFANQDGVFVAGIFDARNIMGPGGAGRFLVLSAIPFDADVRGRCPRRQGTVTSASNNWRLSWALTLVGAQVVNANPDSFGLGVLPKRACPGYVPRSPKWEFRDFDGDLEGKCSWRARGWTGVVDCTIRHCGDP